MSSEQTGVLLVNLGTPDAPTTAAVRRYLREFLSDPAVIDIPAPARWLLVHALIVPFRAPRSAAAYRKVWTPAGSPLLVHGQALVERVRARLPATPVELAMRYGRPSISSALAGLHASGCTRIVVVPLYPHEAQSSTGTCRTAVGGAAAALDPAPSLAIVPPFFDHPGFVAAFAERGRAVLRALDPDHVLFSYHGLPERHIRRADPTGAHCLAHAGCCDTLDGRNRGCYRAQCHATSRALARALSLPDGAWSTSFQSRLGRTKWIEPYTDVVLDELAARGIRRLAVFCPAFVADCLETLEEIEIRAAQQFVAAGGERLALVPSLDSEPRWVDTVLELIAAAGGPREPGAAPPPGPAHPPAE
jgi:ferrochelatase